MFSEHLPFSDGCYFVGIGGVSMSALAKMLHDNNIPVRGCDAAEGVYTRELRDLGIPVTIGEEGEIEENTVVYTGAIEPSRPCLVRAKQAGKRLISRAEFLGMAASSFGKVLSVSGCHGKTTTCCMLAHIFKEAGRSFTCHIGGEDLDLGNYYGNGRECFITEACEFRRSFLSLHSDVAVVLNCDRDHTDCYASQEELTKAYRTFASQAKRVVINAEDAEARTIPHALTFGLRAGDIRGERLRSDGERYSFTVSEGGIPLVRVKLSVVGKVNVYNALAAFAAARLMGFTAEEIRAGLERFRGVGRRFERVGTLCGASVVCDYAHHPREIAATLLTAHAISDGEVHTVFQPHTYTRTRDLMDGFVSALGREESLILYRTYAAREPFDWDGSAVRLAGKLPRAKYVQSPMQLKARLAEIVHPRDLVLVLGAGDIYETAKSILDGSA